jgi:hypothetical protein
MSKNNRHNSRKEGNFAINKILIISEDKKSFLIYLEKILRENRLTKSSILRKTKNQYGHQIWTRVENGTRLEITTMHTETCPKIIATYAKKECGNYQKIFCVFDLPSAQSGHIPKFREAMKIINSNQNIIPITSAPEYEFWLFLHFSNSTSPANSVELEKALNNEIAKHLKKEKFKYSKNELCDDLFYRLLTNQSDAIKRAKQIEKLNLKDSKKLEEQIPHTRIHLLIEEIINS